MRVKAGRCSNSVSVDSFSPWESEKTISPYEKISIGPSNDDLGRLEPLAIALILPVVLAKSETICDVSE